MAVQLILSAGERNVRGYTRDCRILVTKDHSGQMTFRMLRMDTPIGVPVIRLSLRAFLRVMDDHRLQFRELMTEDERLQAAQASLTKYRSTQQYTAVRALREKRKTIRDLDDATIQAIRASSGRPLMLARRFHLSLRVINDVLSMEASDAA